ncbi:MAG: hypothetical protein ACOYXC_09000, partial [Candidatus Rifleibacteriota bacterium]
RLQTVLQKKSTGAAPGAFFSDLPADLRAAIDAGLVKNYPDGGWHFDEIVNRGQAIYYFARLIDYIKINLGVPQLTAEGSNYFEDINPGHWLEPDLKILSGIGAASVFHGLNLCPEKPLSLEEARKISGSITDYFSSNLLILTKDEDRISILPKGALKQLELDNFEISWDNQNWYGIPENSSVPIPQTDLPFLSVFFRHPTFLPTGQVEIPRIGCATVFIKLRRDFASFVKSNLEEFGNGTVSRDQNEIARIRTRIAELKNKRLVVPSAKVVASENQPEEFFPQVVSVVEEETGKNENFKISEVSEMVRAAKIKNGVASHEQKNNQQFISREDKEEMHQVNGTVCDSITGNPLEGAMLAVDGKNQKIGKDGRFSLNQPLNKIIELTLYCEGYKPLQLKHRVGYRTNALSLRLKPEMTNFSGLIVCGDTGSKVSGALIRLGEKATRSNSDGSFQIRGIRPGYHQISCFSKAFLEAHEIVFVNSDQKKPYILSLKPEFDSQDADQETNEILENAEAQFPETYEESIKFAD